MIVMVETREPTSKVAGTVVVTAENVTFELSVDEAFALQRRLLAAVVHVERAQRTLAAKTKSKVNGKLLASREGE